jgi:hypothetical protein
MHIRENQLFDFLIFDLKDRFIENDMSTIKSITSSLWFQYIFNQYSVSKNSISDLDLLVCLVLLALEDLL